MYNLIICILWIVKIIFLFSGQTLLLKYNNLQRCKKSL